jgi:hypothetical protein
MQPKKQAADCHETKNDEKDQESTTAAARIHG